MHVFLVVLMMALLPLRAGLGDVMAMERARPDARVDMHVAAAHDCHEAQRHSSADHLPDHRTASISADNTQADHECSDCVVCHAAALTGTLRPPVLAAAGDTPPQSQAATPLSADPVRRLKPPIG